MSKTKPPHAAPSDDPVELSNTPEAADPDTELSQVAALRALADDRGRKIVLLEKERDELVRDLDAVKALPPKPGPAQDLGCDGEPIRVRIRGIDLLTAPEHALVLRFSGEEPELLRHKASFERQFRALEADGESPVSFDGQSLPADTRAVLESMPT